MSLRPLHVAVALACLAVIAPPGRADETVSPADPTLVLDVGKSASIKVQTDPCNNLSISASVTGGGGAVTVSPAAVNNKTSAQFKVNVAKNAGPTQATVDVVVNSDCGTTTYSWNVHVVMKQQNAEKGLKNQTKAAEKAYKTFAKSALDDAKTAYAAQLAATETALDALSLGPAAGDAAPPMSYHAQRAQILRSAILQGLLIHMLLISELMEGHYTLSVLPIAIVYFNYLLNYSNPLVAPLGFMSGMNTLWFAFLISMHGIATQTALAGIGLFRGYMIALAKLALGYGLPLPFLMVPHGYGMGVRYIQGPGDDVEAPAEGIVDEGIPLQISALVAWNNPLPGPDADAGVNHGFLGVAGMAPPEEGDVTIKVTPVGGTFLGTELTLVVTAASLNAGNGSFAVVFDGTESMESAALGPPSFGTIAPGQYYVEISQEPEAAFHSSGGATAGRYVNVPRMLAQAAK